MKPLVNARPLAATAAGLGGVGGVGGNGCCLAFDEWPAGSHYCCTAAKQPKLLRSWQLPALPEQQRSAWNGPENQTMRNTEMAQINQTRDVLKIEYHVIEIVQ